VPRSEATEKTVSWSLYISQPFRFCMYGMDLQFTHSVCVIPVYGTMSGAHVFACPVPLVCFFMKPTRLDWARLIRWSIFATTPIQLQGSRPRSKAAEDGTGDEPDDHPREERTHQGPRGAPSEPIRLRGR